MVGGEDFVGAAWLAVLACALACGGQVEPSADGGPSGGTSSGGSASTGSGGSANSSGSAGSSGGSVGGSSGETVPPCPVNPPIPGSQCEGPGQQGCAYFAPDGTCEAFVCNGSSVWATSSEGC